MEVISINAAHLKEEIKAIVTKLHGVSGQLEVINAAAEDSEFADAIYGTRDYLQSITAELAAIAEG